MAVDQNSNKQGDIMCMRKQDGIARTYDDKTLAIPILRVGGRIITSKTLSASQTMIMVMLIRRWI
eukprot:scaffold12430_cov74-Skeletonema_dohrnii-CCMP3373.AAC.1